MITCRNCGEPVVEIRPPHASWLKWWSHDRGQSTEPGPEETRLQDENRECTDMSGKYAKPAQICQWMKNDGDPCTRKVPSVNVEQGVFACGLHESKFIKERERQAAVEERKRRDAEQEEIDRFELEIYQEAYDRLTAIDEEMFPERMRPQKRWRYSSSFDRTLEVDIVELERLLRSHAEDTAQVES